MIKAILPAVIMFSVIFILSSGMTIQFKPFHISFSQPLFGLGLILMIIGFMLCLGSFYFKGRDNMGYNKSMWALSNGHVDDEDITHWMIIPENHG